MKDRPTLLLNCQVIIQHFRAPLCRLERKPHLLTTVDVLSSRGILALKPIGSKFIVSLDNSDHEYKIKKSRLKHQFNT